MSALRGSGGIGLQRFVEANNSLALLLLEQIPRAEGENLFFSPLNILHTLAMVFAGSRGETARQMSEIVGKGLGPDETVEAVDALNRNILGGGSGEGHELSVACGAWLKTGINLLDEYAQRAKVYFPHSITVLITQGLAPELRDSDSG